MVSFNSLLFLVCADLVSFLNYSRLVRSGYPDYIVATPSHL